MCESSSDCDSQGQVCDEGVCWGDPPNTATLAVVLIPPSDRPDLAPTELTDIQIFEDGTIAGMEFMPTVSLHGRIVLGCAKGQVDGCGPDALVAAQVIVERAASFEGGAEYRRSVLTNNEATTEEDSFSISLPSDGAEYRVTVIPDEVALEVLAAGNKAVQAPPYSTIFKADSDLEVLWELGTPDQLKSIEGCITNATGNGSSYAGMHVSAVGRWTALSKPERASSVVLTDAQGCYSLSVPIAMTDRFDILAKPGPGAVLPTLRLAGEVVPDPPEGDVQVSHFIAPLIMPNAANPVTFKLPIRGLSGGGTVEPVSGATVAFETQFKLPVFETRDIRVTFSAQAVSNGVGESEPGVALVELYPGSSELNREYMVRVIAPPESEYASNFGRPVPVGTGEGAPVLDSLELDRRVAVSGTFKTSQGEPLAGTPLTVRPSPLVRWELEQMDQQLIDNLQFASDITEENGEFLLWLDRELLGLVARYDFELAPPNFSSSPRWTFESVTVTTERVGDAVDLGNLVLPKASYVRGDVRDPSGLLVTGAEVRWYALPTREICNLTSAPCDPPARLLGIWESNESGQVIAVLPDP